jgi:hypothetical protein
VSDFTMLNRIERVPELNRCSTKAIALWSMLHHALDRRGRVALGGVDYKTVLVRRLAVETGDRQWFYAALRELEAAGLFVIDGDSFALVGHAGANYEERPKAPRGKRPPADLPLTSAVPTPDLLPTSDGPSADLPPTFDQPLADLLSVTPQNDSAQVLQSRVDKSREEERREEPHDVAPAEPDAPCSVPPADEIRTLEARYPTGLCAEAREACALSRRGGKLADSVWLKLLRQLDAHPVERVAEGMRTFAERYADGEKDERYLLGIVRKGAKQTSQRKGVAPAAPHSLFEATYDPQRDDPDLAWRETANA